MKTAKLIYWSSLIMFTIGLVSAILFTLAYSKVIPGMLVCVPIGLMLFCSLIQGLIYGQVLHSKLFIMKYDELINLIEKQDASWRKAEKMADVIGKHEAIKMYNEKNPDKQL